MRDRDRQRRKLRWVWWTLALFLIPVLGWAGWWGWGFTQPVPEPPAGASATSTESHSWIVALSELDSSNDDQSGKNCLGTLIRPDVVVTAAHCLGGDSAEDIEVIAGRDDLRTDHGVTVGVSEVWVHPDRAEGDSRVPLRGLFYPIEWPPADIGLLLLQEELPYEPVALADESRRTQATGEPATMLGYRVSPEDDPTLWQQPTRIADDSVCANRTSAVVSPAPLLLHGVAYDTDAYICVGLDDDAIRVMGTDSGAPLVQNGELVGVLAWGVGTEQGSPEYFTRITNYSTDIEDVIHTWSTGADRT